jgi:predicted nucleic acid-binding protein
MEANVYPDSSFLVSLVSRDTRSDEAIAYMAKAAVSLIFTPLHRLEVRNALRNAVGRGEIVASDERTAFHQLEEDLRDGFLVHMTVEWTNVFRWADELSAKHAAKDGQRTIDLLHVAMALECGVKTFLSFDARQVKLAKAAGLKVKP